MRNESHLRRYVAYFSAVCGCSTVVAVLWKPSVALLIYITLTGVAFSIRANHCWLLASKFLREHDPELYRRNRLFATLEPNEMLQPFAAWDRHIIAIMKEHDVSSFFETRIAWYLAIVSFGIFFVGIVFYGMRIAHVI